MNLEAVFDFIKEKRGYDYPFLYKLINSLPLTKNELNVKGNLDLNFVNVPISLPDNLTVDGNLDLYQSTIKKLPDNLTVSNTLDIRFTYIDEIPKNLIVGNLYLYDTPLTQKYSRTQIRNIIKERGGKIINNFY